MCRRQIKCVYRLLLAHEKSLLPEIPRKKRLGFKIPVFVHTIVSSSDATVGKVSSSWSWNTMTVANMHQKEFFISGQYLTNADRIINIFSHSLYVE
jgi:hypothetical protein